MTTNPLDPEKSWPTRPYGLTNFNERPQETREQEAARTKDGLRQMAVAIADPLALYKEQTRRALEEREYSPDAMVGFADLIGEASAERKDKSRKVIESKIENQKEMLLWALRLYDKVPEAYKADPIKGHRSLVQGHWTGEKLIQFLEKNKFQFKAPENEYGRVDEDLSSTMRYDWGNAARMLRVVARYLDETTRQAA